jgi:GDPmannose 4,6-dehydratase
MHAILQTDAPGEFIVASGELHTVRQFAERAFSALSMDYREYVTETPSVLQRANRQVPFQGDASRLRAVTGWKPEVSFDNLVDMMVRLEMDAAHAE